MAEGWRESMERARELSAAWRAEESSPDATETARYVITFDSGWPLCGDLMAATAGYPVGDVRWSHDPPHHAMEFTATWPALKDVQAAFKMRPVSALRCQRALAGGGGA